MAALIITAILMAACGFTPAVQETEPVALDYAGLTQTIKTYEDAYRDYVNNGEGQVSIVTASGWTPLGSECSSRYLCTDDGVYESCSLTVQRDIEEHDEYFNLGNGLMMFVRSYITSDSQIVINKYISTGNTVFFINDETQSLDPIDDLEALDCFVTFDQVRRVYGNDVSTPETSLAA